MSNELLPCPYCGENPQRAYHNDNVMCDCNRAEMSKRDWNRRFVCPDKNGDKVFAGDKVTAWLRHTEIIEGQLPYDEGVMWWDNKMLLWRVAIKGRTYEKKLFGTFYDNIELIKEKK